MGDALATIAILISLLAFWLNYRTSRRQKHADDPVFSFRFGRPRYVVITNSGATAARDIHLQTKKGSLIRWEDQEPQARCKTTETGSHIPPDPWSSNCDGETRSLAPGASLGVVLSKDVNDDETLILKCRNYMGETVAEVKRLSEVFWQKA